MNTLVQVFPFHVRNKLSFINAPCGYMSTIEDYPGKEYILYTQNKEIDEENIEVLVSIIEENEKGFNLKNIEDDTEWSIVLKAINEMEDLYGEH